VKSFNNVKRQSAFDVASDDAQSSHAFERDNRGAAGERDANTLDRLDDD